MLQIYICDEVLIILVRGRALLRGIGDMDIGEDNHYDVSSYKLTYDNNHYD